MLSAFPTEQAHHLPEQERSLEGLSLTEALPNTTLCRICDAADDELEPALRESLDGEGSGVEGALAAELVRRARDA